MVAKKKKSVGKGAPPKPSTLITSPACTILVDGVAYVTGEIVPGAFPLLGKVFYGLECKD